jgi:hypothetical protein
VAEQPPRVEWRCFHCDDVFTDRDAALAHFGPHIGSEPACHIDAAKYRQMERTVESYRAEDTELHRELHAKSAEMSGAVRHSEEQGYARGLKDARAQPPADSPWVLCTQCMPPIGLEVLAFYRNVLGNGRTVRAEYVPRFSIPAENWCWDDYFDDFDTDDKGDDYVPEGWWERALTPDVGYPVSESITHWMPIPTPPSSETKATWMPPCPICKKSDCRLTYEECHGATKGEIARDTVKEALIDEAVTQLRDLRRLIAAYVNAYDSGLSRHENANLAEMRKIRDAHDRATATKGAGRDECEHDWWRMKDHQDRCLICDATRQV